MPNDLRFSVVVPTRDRPGPLARCLAALEAQEIGGEWEIVVVDDGSSVVEEIAAVVAASGRARLLTSEGSGSTAARNRGIRAAGAAVVLLLDDDCEPLPEWAARLVGAVENGAPVAAGRSVNPNPDDALADATQTVLDYLTLQSVRPDGSTTFAPTYNIGCLRELALAVPFEESYVNQGADRDWCLRVAERGYSIAYEPEAILEHRQSLDLSGFWQKHREYGRGSARFHRRHERRLERPPFYLGLLRAGFRRGAATGLAVCLAQLATGVGFAKNALRRR